MGHKAHVGFVDAHAEGNGGDHDQAFLVEEALLVIGAQVAGQAGVIRQGGEALRTEERRHLVDLFARQAINDAGIAAAFGEKTQQLLARLLFGHDPIEDVRAVETGEKTLGVFQMQALNDLLAGAHVRRGGQGNPRHIGEQLGQLA